MRVALLLACVAAPLAGQSVRSRLETRVPAAAIPVVDSLVQVAGREGLPAEPLVGKGLEGGAKHVVPALIVRAVETRLEQLRDARALLVRGGDAPPATPAEIATVSGALRRGLPPPVVERVVGALPSEPRESALHAIADLVAHRLDADSSATLVIAAIHAGLRGGRLLDVSHAVLAAPAMLVAQQPATPMQGQAPAQADTSKAATKGKHSGKHKASTKKGAKPAAKPAADTGKMKP